MAYPSTFSKALALILGFLVVGAVLPMAVGPASAAPLFKAPFPCGQSWTASTYSGHSNNNNAVDFNLYPGQSDLGQPALASAPGTARSFWDNLGGNMVEIDHGGGWKTWYAHLATVSINNPIDTGEQIGTVGNTTGSGSISPHLHYEQRLNGVAQPVAFDGQVIPVGTSYTANDPKVTSTNCGAVTPGEGTFVSYNGDVFRIAGGAPVYVSNWDHVGGNPGNVRALTAGEFAALRQYPADGTFIVGLAPGDGEHGSVYRVAGGAPIYVSNWDHVGGNPGTTVGVDLFAVRHAGGGGVLDHLRQRPADGTFIVGLAPGDGEHGSVYRVAGGAPIYVSNWDHVGGNPGTTVGVDLFAIKHAGGGGVLDHLRQRPADGTLISGWAPGDPDHGSVYRVAGGAPIYVSNWSHIGGDPGTTVGVDLFAIKHAGGGGVLDHLRQRPADGTLISGWAPGDPDHGSVYRVAGGAPIYVSNWSHIGGDPGTTVGVDLSAIRNAGSSGVWNHLLYRPSDGTYLKAANKTYRVAQGAPILQSASHDGVVVDHVAIANAGKPGVWSHLAAPPSQAPVVQPEDPTAVQLAAQTVKVQRKTVKKGRSLRLPATTSQGARLTWRSWSKRVCKVTGRHLKAKRKGSCRIGGLAPAVPGFSAFATTFVVRVR